MSQPKEPPVQLEYERPAPRERDGIRMLALVLPPTVLIPLGAWILWFAIFGGRTSPGENVFLIVWGTLFITFGMCYPLNRLAKFRRARKFEPAPKEPLPWSGPNGKAYLVEKLLRPRR